MRVKKREMSLQKEDYGFSKPPEFTSRRYRTWEEYIELNPETPESARPKSRKI